MKVNFKRENTNDEIFKIYWPDSQMRFYLIDRDVKPIGVKEAVYILMDKFRTKFYIGETGPSKKGGVQNRSQTHKWQKNFWNCALVIEDRNEEFKEQDIRKWFERRLFEIAKERSAADKKYEVLSSAGKQEDLPYENRIRDILAVCRFLGIPWGYAIDRKQGDVSMGATKGSDGSNKPSKPSTRRKTLPNFTYEMAGVPEGAELKFTEGNQRVMAKGKNEVVFEGVSYSLSGFVKKFMPDRKRNRKDSYRGPAYFTFNGKLLTELREKKGKKGNAVVVHKRTAAARYRWVNKTQLSKLIASHGGNAGSDGHILLTLSRKRRCPPDSKWRSVLSEVGLKFDKENYVVDWTKAKNPVPWS